MIKTNKRSRTTTTGFLFSVEIWSQSKIKTLLCMELARELGLSNWYPSKQKVLKNNCHRENTMTHLGIMPERSTLLVN